MYCAYCGTPIPDDAVFCTSCGKQTNRDSQQHGDNTSLSDGPASNKSTVSFAEMIERYRREGPASVTVPAIPSDTCSICQNAISSSMGKGLAHDGSIQLCSKHLSEYQKIAQKATAIYEGKKKKTLPPVFRPSIKKEYASTIYITLIMADKRGEEKAALFLAENGLFENASTKEAEEINTASKPIIADKSKGNGEKELAPSGTREIASTQTQKDWRAKKCPRCGSNDIRFQVVETGQMVKDQGLGFTGHMDNAGRAITAVATLGVSNLFWKKQKGTKDIRTLSVTMGVCQSCGHTWKK